MKMAIVLSLGLTMGAVQASDAQGRGGGAPNFKKLDMNGDEMLTMDEIKMAMPVQEGWMSAESMMQVWDVDGDGAVTMKEFMARSTGGRGRTP